MKIRRGRPPSVTFDQAEQGLLASLAVNLSDLLTVDEPEDASDADDPLSAIVGQIESGDQALDDPVMQRLLPDAYRDDDEAASEWRRFGRSQVRAAKLEAMKRVVDDLDEGSKVRLDDEAAEAWLTALNDMRLAIGARLDIQEDWTDTVLELDQDDPRLPSYAVYEWLTMLQDQLIGALNY